MPSRGSSEKDNEREKRRGDERGSEERSICSGMHSALIALSASRVYTLLRAEPLKKPSFTLPTSRNIPVPSRAAPAPFVKSLVISWRAALCRSLRRTNILTLDIVERKTFPDFQGGESGRREGDLRLFFSSPIAAREFRGLEGIVIRLVG